MNKKVLGALGVLLMLSGCSHSAVKCEGFKEEFRHDEVLFSTGKAVPSGSAPWTIFLSGRSAGSSGVQDTISAPWDPPTSRFASM